MAVAGQSAKRLGLLGLCHADRASFARPRPVASQSYRVASVEVAIRAKGKVKTLESQSC